jgi:hypothetical protein
MAIKGYEDITHELTEFERETLLPIFLAKIATHKGRARAITNERLRQYLLDRTGKQIGEPRIRKIAEYIRQTHLEDKLIACRKGYFVAEFPEELQEWLDTMKQRRNAEGATIAAGEKALRQWTGYKQPNQFKQRKVDTKIIQPNIL